jgi:lambda family phage minor tail protein L
VNAQFPRPHIRVSNIGGALAGAMRQFGDLLGQELIRTLTYAQFLDNGSTPDPTAKFPDEIWRIDRKVKQNRVLVEFELSSPIDQEGMMLPARQVLKDGCSHVYRRWNAATQAFDYTHATCPFSGSTYFSANNVATTAEFDVCGKHFSSCRARFGTAPLPFLGFPGTSPGFR